MLPYGVTRPQWVNWTFPISRAIPIYKHDYLTLKQLGIFLENVILFFNVFRSKCNILVQYKNEYFFITMATDGLVR